MDITVIGATGFTGQYVCDELNKLKSGLKIGIAGRSMDKLNNLVSKFNLSKEFVKFKVDVKDKTSLKNICKQSRVVINCVGPFRFYGDAVIKACLDNGCHYVDISGEPEFIEKSFVLFDEMAKKKKLLVISACGFDSVPADLGASHLQSLLPKESKLVSIESFLSFKSGVKGSCINYGTYETAVESIAGIKSLQKFRKDHFFKVDYSSPKLIKKSFPFFSEYFGKWAIVFPGSDASIVRLSQVIRKKEFREEAVQYSAYMTISSIFQLIPLVLFGLTIFLFTKFDFTKKLLLKHPKFFSFGVFTKDGPTSEQMADASFSMTLIGLHQTGDSLKKIVTKVSGPEPGYVATPIFATQAALSLLDPMNLRVSGGVCTPSTAFKTDIFVKKLTERGIKFDLIEKQ